MDTNYILKGHLKINNHFLNKFLTRLSNMPAPGGNGCHSAILGAANLGAMAGLQPEQVHDHIRNSIPPGRRKVPDSEIQAAVYKAFYDHNKTIMLHTGELYHRYTTPRKKPLIHSRLNTLINIIRQGIISKESEICDCSPIPLYGKRIYDIILFLNTLFDSDDLIWMGKRYEPGIIGQNIKSVSEWISFFQSTNKIPPFFIINPLSGRPATKLTGDGETYRGDHNVLKFKYALVEFDNISLEDQFRFWSAIKLPIRCLIHTGGKSIHALLDIQKLTKVETFVQWNKQVKLHLYDQLLRPLGVDAACSNAARLSRLPSHFRTEKNSMQRVIWLSPEGRSLIK